MNHVIGPEVRDEIRALCTKISVDHSLDPDIQEELCGHMEDKLLSYMDGNERLTERDAFVLVREHFGEPAAVEDLFQRVYYASPRVLRVLIRLIGCINTAFGGVGTLLNLYGILAGLLIIQNAAGIVGRNNLLAGPYTPILLHAILFPLSCMMLASGIGILSRRPWGRTWTMAYAAYALITLPLTQWVTHLGGFGSPENLTMTAITLVYVTMNLLVMLRNPRSYRLYIAHHAA